MRWLLGSVLAFLLLLGMAWAEEQYASTPGIKGILVLRGLWLEEGTLYVTVDTGGCTTKEDIVARVQEKGKIDGNLPHYEITFIREVPDTCDLGITEDVLVYDLREDLHLELPCAISVTNPVVFEGGKEFGEGEEVEEEKEEETAPALKTQEEDLLTLRQELQSATIWALEAEIARYETSERPDRDERIALLREELERLRKLPPEEYPLPKGDETEEKDFGLLLPPVVREVTVTAPPQGLGAILEVEGMTRSGPFFHVAGIRGGDFSVFRAASYRLTLYLLYRREYFMNIPSYYVYIASWEERLEHS